MNRDAVEFWEATVRFRIERMYIAPVKSLAVSSIDRAFLDKPGIAGDRAFFIVDGGGRIITQREQASLVQISTEYDVASGRLTLIFPDATRTSGVPEPAESLSSDFYGGKQLSGALVRGPWAEALSEFAGDRRELVQGSPGSLFDAFPISMCSTGSLTALSAAAGTDAVDPRRFRQNLYVASDVAHVEDEWLGGDVRVGDAIIRVKMRDPRCVIVTHSPATGATDLNVLKVIAGYRSDQPKQTNFGVYCTVVQPGVAAVGDEVMPLLHHPG